MLILLNAKRYIKFSIASSQTKLSFFPNDRMERQTDRYTLVIDAPPKTTQCSEYFILV